MMPPPPPPPPPGSSQLFPDDKNEQTRIFKAEAVKTRNLLLGISGLYFVGNALPVIIAGGAGGSIALAFIITIIFLGMGLLAITQPFIAAVISGVVIVIMFILLIVATGQLAGAAGWVIILPWLIFLAAAALGIAAFMSANKAEQARKKLGN